VADIWSANVKDRSKADYRLGHILKSADFTKSEAIAVLAQTSKASDRAPTHRESYAINIVDKIWGFENRSTDFLSESVASILQACPDNKIKGERLRCWKYIDDTAHGFRLTQVIGLVAGSGVGKTAIALNMFYGFVHNNHEYDHFFIPLEQPKNEIAERWKVICGSNTQLHEKVQVLSNYDNDGNYRHLSLKEIEDYVVQYTEKTGRKVGCVVIDHIGVLADKTNKKSENESIISTAKQMKAFALRTNTLLIMQSQTSREKAGIGDLELDKDAAYGSTVFEQFCDYLITIWQPLKRCYMETDCPTITAFKFCKIRHKNKLEDFIQEDVPYRLYFDPTTQRLSQLTEEQKDSFTFWVTKATNKRKLDRKTDIVTYHSTRWDETEEPNERAANISKNEKAA
jgi:KaiC/GvpD/RAD55 family RecA-like ATPase